MSVRRRATGIVTVTLFCVAVGLQTPAAAHHKPGHSGGPGTNCPTPGGAYPPGQCDNPESASVSEPTLTRGESFFYYAQGFEPGSQVTVTMFSTPVVLGTAAADTFTFIDPSLAIPSGASFGPHNLVATGAGADGQPLSLTVPIRVVDTAVLARTNPPGSSPGSAFGLRLPRTGTEIVVAALLGLLLLAAGSAVIAAGRRRQTA